MKFRERGVELREVEIFGEYHDFLDVVVDEHTKKKHKECHRQREDNSGCDSKTSFNNISSNAYRDLFSIHGDLINLRTNAKTTPQIKMRFIGIGRPEVLATL